jgi:8-oxo-dGTP pyrophosphatase MutT (NUDIX family)
MPATTREAGAIAIRDNHHPRQFLLVRAKQADGQWIFPKGHIEPNETPGDAALRELREEAGIEGRLLGKLGKLRFPYGGELIDVDYFLVEALDEGASEEGRGRVWLTFDEAIRKLTFDDARNLLVSHKNRLNELAPERHPSRHFSRLG